MGIESNAKQNLENFSKNIIEFGTGTLANTTFVSFQAALEYVFQLAENERLILAVDEYPYVARSSLFEEPENLLKQEVREPALYNAIVTAIAVGASRMAEISTKVGENTSVCAAYLKNLIALGLIQKETPYDEKSSRKSISLETVIAWRVTSGIQRTWTLVGERIL